MYDIVFISYQEPNADDHWNLLKSRFPFAKRVHGVKGIHQAHITAASRCFTEMIWVVDGDAIILDSFMFNYKPRDTEYVHVWRSRNPINDLEYGNGGVKLLPRLMTLNMDVSKPDMTTSISTKFQKVEEISNITAFNSDPFNTWKSAFRECTKLSSAVIDRQKQIETDIRLDAWCSMGIDRVYGEYSIKGAIAGREYGKQQLRNIEALKLINDFDWLNQRFKESI
jgi:hypothetical protein